VALLLIRNTAAAACLGRIEMLGTRAKRGAKDKEKYLFLKNLMIIEK
jgi:hypothetical protein